MGGFPICASPCRPNYFCFQKICKERKNISQCSHFPCQGWCPILQEVVAVLCTKPMAGHFKEAWFIQYKVLRFEEYCLLVLVSQYKVNRSHFQMRLQFKKWCCIIEHLQLLAHRSKITPWQHSVQTNSHQWLQPKVGLLIIIVTW